MTERGLITLKVMYSCHLCGLHDAPVFVPARESEENVKPWIDRTILLLAKDHAARRPGCRPRQLHDLKIPITGAGWIGGPPLQ